jgi:probable phosphoglycerate mutase
MTTPRLEPRAFWFLRHGETEWNTRSVAQGRTEVPLNAHGLEQAHQSAAALRNRGIATIVSSTMGRAKATAEIVAAALDLPVTYDEGLIETSYGDREGQAMTEWFSDWVYERSTPPGGESFADLRVRAVSTINKALARPPVLLVIAHGGLFRAVRSVMGLEPLYRTPNGTPFFCEPPAEGQTVWTLSGVG